MLTNQARVVFVRMNPSKSFFKVGLVAHVVHACVCYASLPPCAHVDRSLSDKEGEMLSGIVKENVGVANIRIVESYKYGLWRILKAEGSSVEPGYLIYTEQDGDFIFRGSWGLGGHIVDTGIIDYVNLLKEVPDIPKQLAKCIVWGVLNAEESKAQCYKETNDASTGNMLGSTRSSAYDYESLSKQGNLQEEFVDWTSVASSADGLKLIAGSKNYGLWISATGGRTWQLANHNRNSCKTLWISVASSANGSVLLAAAMWGGIWISSTGGRTWLDVSPRDSSAEWVAVTISGDGTKLAAVDLDGIWTSEDQGSNWLKHFVQVPTNKQENWFGISASLDGKRLVVLGLESGVWTSVDWGKTFLYRNIPTRTSGARWTAVTVSSDGNRIAATESEGGIWVSKNFGATWGNYYFTNNRRSSQQWKSIASSFDGSKLVVVSYSGQAYLSNNSGHSWKKPLTNNLSDGLWYSVASSSNGVNLVAAEFRGNIWTSIDSGKNWSRRTIFRAHSN